jgi:hypothetical protein
VCLFFGLTARDAYRFLRSSTEKQVQEKVPRVPGARRTKKFFDKAEFTALYQAVGKLDFTPDFNPSIEYFLMIEEVPLTERLLAVVKLQAWGNQKELAVHDDDRKKPFTLADAARKLGVRRQRIYEPAAKLVKRCQLRIEGQNLYPVADPAAERRNRRSESTRNGSCQGLYQSWGRVQPIGPKILCLPPETA